MTDNKRRFSRIPFDAGITLTLTDDPMHQITGELKDISLKGAMIEIDTVNTDLVTGREAELMIQPQQSPLQIAMTVEVAYVLSSQNLYGLNITSLDIESAGHLRRLIEVNLGDENILQRELANLIEAMEEEHIQD